MFNLVLIGIATLLAASVIVAAISMRVVVSTNTVDIVQSSKRTISYGRGEAAGNVYYAWPAWVPMIGVRVIHLPTSVFSIRLDDYAAYDVGRVPFEIDIIAFFRVTDSNLAAQRVSSVHDVEDQLKAILQGVCRTILASSEIEQILQGRAQFGEMFTKEVDDNLKQWGLNSVKQIELMDIRDVNGSKVIENIMAKKKSLIEKESRITVANNTQAAQVAEIDAQQTVAVRQQEAMQLVGQKTANKEAQIGIAQQQQLQVIAEAAAITAEKNMAVERVKQVRQAEINRDAQLVVADQAKRVKIVQSEADQQQRIIEAEGTKQQTILLADGNLEQARRNATGIELEGSAKGAAETAVLMAPVNSQIALAKEIGANENYQTYLVSVRKIEADQAVGIAQAEALTKADVKVIANTGQATDGVKSVMDLFTAKGGTQVAGMVEALAQSPVGQALIKKLGGNGAHA